MADLSKNAAAFPSPGVVLDERSCQRQQGAYEGMSLRDYFAAKAMQAMCGETWPDQNDRREIVRRAWSMADDMLQARAQ